MKTCDHCQGENPDSARYCMACGRQLGPAVQEESAYRAGFGSLGTSLLVSVALSLLLFFVFRIPVFFLVGFLPLLWNFRRKGMK